MSRKLTMDNPEALNVFVIFEGEPIKGCLSFDPYTNEAEIYLYDFRGRVATSQESLLSGKERHLLTEKRRIPGAFLAKKEPHPVNGKIGYRTLKGPEIEELLDLEGKPKEQTREERALENAVLYGSKRIAN